MRILAFVAAIFLGAASAQESDGPRRHSHPWLLSWIPPSCCVTNDCCWEIAPTEVRPLANDHWEVRATGQVLKRTAFSPDGRYYRCACDYDHATQKWLRHQGANTRCIYTPLNAF